MTPPAIAASLTNLRVNMLANIIKTGYAQLNYFAKSVPQDSQNLASSELEVLHSGHVPGSNGSGVGFGVGSATELFKITISPTLRT